MTRKARQAVAISAIVGLVILAMPIAVYFGLTQDELLAEISLPDGARCRIYYKHSDRPLFALDGIEGLWYEVDAQADTSSGWMTGREVYDLKEDVDLTHATEASGVVRVKETSRNIEWVIRSDGSCKRVDKTASVLSQQQGG